MEGTPGDERTRRYRGAVLLGGAAVLALAIGVGPLAFYWLPPIAGVTYLAAAAVSGKRGPLWVPGAMVTAWGAAALVLFERGIDNFKEPKFVVPAAFLVAFGIGVVVCALLERRGFAIDALSVGVTLLVSGVFLTAEVYVPSVTGNIWPYAALLAAVGLWELRPAGRQTAEAR